MSEFNPKDQIAYVPSHVRAWFGGSHGLAINAKANGVEYGFVTSVRPSKVGAHQGVENKKVVVFCRFWSPFGHRLRTSANSEGCNPDDLILHKCTEDYVIEAICGIVEYGIDLGKR